MEQVVVNITIGGYTLDFAESFEVQSSWKTLTDTATIIEPAKLKFDRGTLRDSIRKGSEVLIQAGYLPNLQTIFRGFVTSVKPSTPVEIECEDYMWKLKQVQVNDVASNETLRSFLERNIKDIEIDCFDVSLPKYIASKITATQLLEELKKDFGFPAFIRDNKLVIGKQYDPDNNTEHTCTLHYDVAEDDLEYETKDDISFNVTAISNLQSGEKIEIQLGDPEGESRTLNFYDLNKTELQKIAQSEFDRLYYDGYRGSFTYFGYAVIKPGDVVNLQDRLSSDKQGRYFVDDVTYSLSQSSGIRQTVQIGPIIS